MTIRWPFGRGLGGMRSRLVVALDVDSQREAMKLVSRLIDDVGMFKVGKQLFLRAGPAVVRSIRDKGSEVFLDLKFHDIPRTVAKAGVEAARLGVRMFDVHASGSLEMMTRTVAEVGRVCRTEGLRRPKILAVTVLTSLNREDLKRVGVNARVDSQVVRLARLAREGHMDGVVASPQEIVQIRRECGRNFIIVTPGVRPVTAEWDDQKRVMSPEEAIRNGADYLVVGRSIVEAEDPVEAARDIVRAMEHGTQAAPPRVRLFPARPPV